jgi:hypothetical protein
LLKFRILLRKKDYARRLEISRLISSRPHYLYDISFGFIKNITNLFQIGSKEFRKYVTANAKMLSSICAYIEASTVKPQILCMRPLFFAFEHLSREFKKDVVAFALRQRRA